MSFINNPNSVNKSVEFKNDRATHVCRQINLENGSSTPVMDSLINKGLVKKEIYEKNRRRVI